MTTLAMNAPFTRSGRPGEGSEETMIPPVVRRLAISLLAVLAALGLSRLALHRFDTPVRELAISGVLTQVQPDEVRLVIAPMLESQKLFALDLDAIRAAVERLPWVARVRIDRQWPARLGVRITEREPFARWGESDALSTEGVVFAPGSVVLPETLPRLEGAPGREREVMAMYGQLSDRLSETPFALKGLTQDARGEWTGTTRQGIALRFGRSNPLELVPALKNTVLPALGSRLDSVQRIDLRYANGFAVGWLEHPKPGQTAPAATASPEAPVGASQALNPGVTP